MREKITWGPCNDWVPDTAQMGLILETYVLFLPFKLPNQKRLINQDVPALVAIIVEYNFWKKKIQLLKMCAVF